MKVERRKIGQVDIERTDSKVTLRGLAAPYGEISSRPIAGQFYERFSPGAFDRALRNEETDVVAVINHDDQAVPLARYTGGSGTLKLANSERGLLYEFEPPDTERARELIQAIERGDIRGMSFAFRSTGEKWDQRHEDLPLREVTEAELYDICFATNPYYTGTTISARGESLESTTPDDYKKLAEKQVSGLPERSRKLRLIEIALTSDDISL